jgi:hypothetical protein
MYRTSAYVSVCIPAVCVCGRAGCFSQYGAIQTVHVRVWSLQYREILSSCIGGNDVKQFFLTFYYNYIFNERDSGQVSFVCFEMFSFSVKSEIHFKNLSTCLTENTFHLQ